MVVVELAGVVRFLGVAFETFNADAGSVSILAARKSAISDAGVIVLEEETSRAGSTLAIVFVIGDAVGN